MIATDYQQKAIPLVVVNPDTSKYQVTPQAISLLKSIAGPIGVISVAGLYRTGKSYLLNRILLDKQKGFGVGNTVIACTKGLWCWGKPLAGTSSDGKAVSILVIDSQGIGATQQDANHDTKIFTLAVLASSCFIYNSMGSIDQNALQNLSLVVNLTKHIQLQSENQGQQQDPDKIANYFPSFFWIVRDFSLQLVDPENKSITQKQYLERALMEQNGTSEDVQQKNRIRRLLRSFFKERECYTFVRPEVDEDKLQNLDNIKLSDLRPQFAEQVLNFRKIVTTKIKIKTMNDKNLDGAMYCNMLSSYVQAINDGAVPNIQSAWNYICMQKCQSVKNQCFAYFSNETNLMKLPLFQEQFEDKIQQLKESSLAKFRKMSMGDVSQKYQKEFYQMLKDQIKIKRQENARQASSILQTAVNEVFTPIAKKVKKGEYTSFEQFQSDCSLGYNSLLERGLDFPNAKVKYLQLYKKVQKQGAQIITKNLKQNLVRLQQVNQTKETEYKNQINFKNQQNQTSKKINNQKISQLDRQNIEAKNKIQRLQFDLNRLNKQKQFQENNLNKTLITKKAQMDNIKRQLMKKAKEDQQKCQQIQKDLIMQQKQWEKQKQITKARIQNNEQKIRQLQNILKTKEVLTQKSRSEQITTFKQSINKLQLKKSELETRNKEYKQKNQQFLSQVRQLKDRLQQTEQKLQKRQRRSKEQISVKTKQIQRLKQEVSNKQRQMEDQIRQIKQKLSKQSLNLQQGSLKQKNQIVQLKSKLSKMENDYEDKVNKLTLDLQFKERKVASLQSEVATSRLQFQSKIEKLKSQMSKESTQKQKSKFVEIQRQTTIKITQIQTRYESQKKTYMFELESYKSKSNSLEKTLKQIQQKLSYQTNQKLKIQSQKNMIIRSLQNKNKELQNRQNQVFLQKQNSRNEKIRALQQQLQSLKQNSEDQMRSIHERFQTQVRQLKLNYQFEIDQANNRGNRQRERVAKKASLQLQQRKNEYESKIQELQIQNQTKFKNFSDELQYIQQNLKNAERLLQSNQKQYSNFKKQHYQFKQISKNKELQLSTRLQELTLNYRKQKAVFQKKLSQLQAKVNQMQKEILNKTNDCALLSMELQRIKISISQIEQEYSTHKQQCTKTIQHHKALQKQRQSEYISIKLEYQKRNALLTQQLSFKIKKCEELDTQLRNMQQEHDQKIKNIKKQAEQTIFNKTQKLLAQNQVIQVKYENLKKQSRQKDISDSKHITNLNTEVAVYKQKMTNLQKSYLTYQTKTKVDIASYQKQLQNLKSSSKIQKEVILQENNKLKDREYDLQTKNKQIQRKYERQYELNKYKIQNYQSILENQKKDLTQKIRSLQENLQKITNLNLNNKSQIQSKSMQILTKTETTYKSQISQMSETFNKTIYENQIRIRQNEEQFKRLRDSLSAQRRTRQIAQKQYQLKSNQWQQYQRKYSSEIDKLKRQRQIRSLQNQKTLEKQKELLKQKLAQSQKRFRTLETQKTAQLFDFEKYKTQFRTQKSIMQQTIVEMKQSIAKLERDKSVMVSDVNKLKQEKRRSSSYIKLQKSYLEQRKSAITVNGRKYEGKSVIKKEEHENSANKQNLTMNQSLIFGD